MSQADSLMFLDGVMDPGYFLPRLLSSPSLLLLSLSSFLPLDAVTAGSNHPAVWQSELKFHLFCSLNLHFVSSLSYCLFFPSSASVELLSCLVFRSGSIILQISAASDLLPCVDHVTLPLPASPLCQSEDKLLWRHHERLEYFLFQEEKPESPSAPDWER